MLSFKICFRFEPGQAFWLVWGQNHVVCRQCQQQFSELLVICVADVVILFTVPKIYEEHQVGLAGLDWAHGEQQLGLSWCPIISPSIISLLSVNFKFPLHPHQKYYITQYEELGFSWLTQMRGHYTIPILTTSPVQFSLKGWENVLGNERANERNIPRSHSLYVYQCLFLDS